MLGNAVDVRDASTFDAELAARVDRIAEMNSLSLLRARSLLGERKTQMLRGPVPSNPFGAAYFPLLDELTPILNSSAVSGWYHTRLTNDEILTSMAGGLGPATPKTLCDWLTCMIAAGDLTRGEADQPLVTSPFQVDRSLTRIGRFRRTAEPQKIGDGDVELLLGKRVGVSIGFSNFEGAMAKMPSRIESGRVIEVAIPIAATPDAFSAAKAVVATLGRAHGAPADSCAYGFQTTEPLPLSADLRVHAEGEGDYADLVLVLSCRLWEPTRGHSRTTGQGRIE